MTSQLPHYCCAAAAPLIALFIAIGLGTAAEPAAAKSTPAPAKVKHLKKVRKSFEACRKDALGQLKKGTISKKKFEIAHDACNENFPGASLYTACKRNALKTAAGSGAAPEESLSECKRLLAAASFDAKSPLPFFVDRGQLFFAGIGLNRAMPASSLKPPNFDCGKLVATSRNPKEAEYFLFGNHPRTFAGLDGLKGEAILRTLKLKGPKFSQAKGLDVASFGRVYGDPRTPNGVVFFPSQSCDFDSDPGEILSGLSAYYLLDTDNSAVTPYFGIAYFKADQAGISTPKLVQALIKELNDDGSAVFKAVKKKGQAKGAAPVTFVVSGPVTETDDDQDPKNLCKPPRQNRFVGVVQGRKDDPESPEFVVLANIRNLCDFGDKLAKKLIE